MIRYPDTEQFRHAIKKVQYDRQVGEHPTLLMRGTVKIHGTNASVVVEPDGTQYVQSRNSIITIDDDNLGFAKWHTSKKEYFEVYANFLKKIYSFGKDTTVVFYGEWAGKGIQSGVAVSEVDKFFYIFGIKICKGEDTGWISCLPISRGIIDDCEDIIFAKDIWNKYISIDFNIPNSVTNKLIKITEEVERECPIGKYFGVSGTGEGVVWDHINSEGRRIAFKVKGEKHSASKVKKLVAVDVEKMASVEIFVAYAVTENRLKQGFTEACNNIADRKLLGKFIKWISTDVNKEESDTLEASGLTMKDVGSALTHKAKLWFFEKEKG